MGDRSDHHQRGDSAEQESATEEERIAAVGADQPHPPEHRHEHQESDERHEIEQPPLGAQRSAHHGDRTPHHRERCAEQQPAGAAERAEIGPVELRDLTSEHRPVGIRGHLRRPDRTRRVHQRRDDGDAECGQHQPAADVGDPPRPTAEQGEHHERPHDVELFLDGEAPQVPQRRELVRRRVAGTGPDLVPVRHVEQSGDHVAAELAEGVAFEQRGPDRESDQQREQRRQESPGAAHPEAASCRRSRSVPSPRSAAA